MLIKVNEIICWSHSDYKDKMVNVDTIIGDDAGECFERVYALERGARYDNARRYEIADPNMEREYQEWKKHGVTIEMYYGSATVD